MASAKDCGASYTIGEAYSRYFCPSQREIGIEKPSDDPDRHGGIC